MYSVDDIDFEGSFSDDTKDLFKDHMFVVDVYSLNGVLLNNRVIVEVETFMYDQIKTESGFQLWVDNTFEISNFAVRSGKIAKLPEKLECWKDDKDSMAWETEIEAKVGDDVWFYAMAAHSGEKLLFQGKKYVIMSYEDLYVAKRGDKVVCLNGNVLLKPIIRHEKALSYSSEYIDPDYAIVAHIGSINKEYETEYREDDNRLKEGMKVCISGIIPRRLEMPPYLDFDGQEYIVCQNYEILGFLQDD